MTQANSHHIYQYAHTLTGGNGGREERENEHPPTNTHTYRKREKGEEMRREN